MDPKVIKLPFWLEKRNLFTLTITWLPKSWKSLFVTQLQNIYIFLPRNKRSNLNVKIFRPKAEIWVDMLLSFIIPDIAKIWNQEVLCTKKVELCCKHVVAHVSCLEVWPYSLNKKSTAETLDASCDVGTSPLEKAEGVRQPDCCLLPEVNKSQQMVILG